MDDAGQARRTGEDFMLSRRSVAFAAAGASVLLASEAHAQQNTPATPSQSSTMDRIRQTKTLRIAALPGEAPYFNKDIATGEWSGMCIAMTQDIAKIFDAKVEYLESTYGNSVLDLQAGKIDLAYSLNPTPLRALVIDFTHPFYMHGFGMVGKKGFTATDWADIDKPEVKVACDIGSVHEIAARRFAGHAQIIALPKRDDCILAVQSGRADCVILAVNLGLTAVKKNPELGKFMMLHHPTVKLPTCMGIPMQVDKRWQDFLNAWVDYNRGVEQIRQWLYDGLAINGVKPDDVPADVEL
jgi:polar amino acid transport system substrate-binding protein